MGNYGDDKLVYVSLGLANNENCTIGYKEYDKRTSSRFINLGFDKSSDG